MTRSRDFAKGATRSEFDYTATAGQTTFTGNDNDSESLSYTAGQIDVYLNGSHLNQTDDYVATNGTSVVLQSGAAAGDILHIVAYGSFNVANVVATRDLEGNEFILDDDGDTSITADTDDQIDIKIGGSDKIVMTASAITIDGDTVLTNDTSGTIIQVVSATDSSTRTRSSSSYGTLTLNAAITPTDSANKILCLFNGIIEVSSGGRANLCLSRAISGGATTEVNGGSSLTREQDTSDTNVGVHFVFVDSPSTTSACTYTLHGKTENGNQLSLIGNGAISTLTLLEVVA